MITDSITQYITRCHLKTWPPPIIKSRTSPIITMRSVHESKAIDMHSRENLSCPCNHEMKFSQKYPRFNEVIWKYELPLYELKYLQKWGSFDVTWKFALPLLSRGKLFPKIKAVLLMWLENLACPYYHELKCLQI